MDYQIVHAVTGRIRIRIAQLAKPEVSNQLQGLLGAISFVTNVRINPLVESIIITYKPKLVSDEVMQAHLAKAIAQVLPPPAPSTVPAPAASAPTARPPTVPKAQPPSQPPVSPDIQLSDPWDDSAATQPTHQPTHQPTAAASQAAASQAAAPDVVSLLEENSLPSDTAYSTSKLAQRLQVTVQSVTHRRSKPDFETWSQAHDPDSIAWRYTAAAKTFQPIQPPPDAPKTENPAASDDLIEPSSPVREAIESTIEQLFGTESGKVVINRIEHAEQAAGQAVSQAQTSLIKLGETTLEIVGEAMEVISKSQATPQKPQTQSRNGSAPEIN